MGAGGEADLGGDAHGWAFVGGWVWENVYVWDLLIWFGLGGGKGWECHSWVDGWRGFYGMDGAWVSWRGIKELVGEGGGTMLCVGQWGDAVGGGLFIVELDNSWCNGLSRMNIEGLVENLKGLILTYCLGLGLGLAR